MELDMGTGTIMDTISDSNFYIAGLSSNKYIQISIYMHYR